MRKTISLNQGWDFQKQGETVRVDLPHCWNAVDVPKPHLLLTIS